MYAISPCFNGLIIHITYFNVLPCMVQSKCQGISICFSHIEGRCWMNTFDYFIEIAFNRSVFIYAVVANPRNRTFFPQSSISISHLKLDENFFKKTQIWKRAIFFNFCFFFLLFYQANKNLKFSIKLNGFIPLEVQSD